MLKGYLLPCIQVPMHHMIHVYPLENIGGFCSIKMAILFLFYLAKLKSSGAFPLKLQASCISVFPCVPLSSLTFGIHLCHYSYSYFIVAVVRHSE